MKALAPIILIAVAISAFVWWKLSANDHTEPAAVVSIYEGSAICHASRWKSSVSAETPCDTIGAQLSTAMNITRGARVAITAYNNMPSDTIEVASKSLTASGYVVSDIHMLKAGFIKDEP